DAFIQSARVNQKKLSTYFAQSQKQSFLSLEDARKKSYKIDWASYQPPRPSQVGHVAAMQVELKDVIPYIDWSPFFWTWELKGVYPKIFDHAKWGAQAKTLYQDAQTLLQKLLKENAIRPQAVWALWPANSVGD